MIDACRPWIVERAARTPRRPAVRIGSSIYDFASVAERTRSLALHLASAGPREGDVLAALVGNDLAAVLLVHAAPWCGVTLLPLNTRLSAHEIRFQLQDAGAAMLVHGGGDLARKALAAAPPRLARVEIDASGALDRGGQVVRAEAGRLREKLDPSLPYAVLYTSGTTGQPKGAILSVGNFLASAEASAQLLGTCRHDDWLAALPLCHVGGLSILTRSVLMGTCVTLQSRFDAEEMNRELDGGRVTLVSLVATMLRRLLEAREGAPAPASLRCVLLGGGPAPPDLLERAQSMGFPVAPTYGLTEATSQVATRPPGSDAVPLDGCLEPLPGVSLRIVGETGEILGPETEGEIQVAGPTVMQGYLGNARATDRALAGGWLHTGDVGVLDRRGRLRVLDRRSDLIVSGGENIYPTRVEAVLASHPAVAEAGVAGVPDDEFGSRPAAWLVARKGELPDDEALRAHCRQQLPGYAVPVAVHWVSELPRTSAGKLLRRLLGKAEEA